MGKILDALAEAGAAFEVKKVGLVEQDRFEVLQDYRAVVREDTGQVLGVVGSKFGLISHRQAFEGIDYILPSLEAKHGPATVAAQCYRRKSRGGGVVEGSQAHVRIQFRDGDTGKVARGAALFPCIDLSHGVDGGGALVGSAGAYVLVCSNGLVVGDRSLSITMRHTSGIQRRLERMEAAVERAIMRLPNLNAESEKWSRLQVGSFETERALRYILTGDPEPKDREARNMKEIAIAYRSAPGAEPGTVWGVVQAATYYATHLYGRGENQLASSVSAPANKMRARALRLARASAEAGSVVLGLATVGGGE